MTQKEIYVERLSRTMRSAGQENWLSYDMADISELAGLWPEWMQAISRKQQEEIALKSAKILGVEIRHCKH